MQNREASPSSYRKRRARSLGLRVTGLLGWAACLAWLACADPDRSSTDTGVDAAVPDCERGASGCACLANGRCLEELLCITGRCVSTQGRPDPEEPDVVRPGLPRPPVTPAPNPSAGDAAPPPSAGDASALTDASVSDASADARADTD
jgi:hypothetical protein